MATPGRKYLLKILSGPNQGAEAPVGTSDLTIGSADTADIILGDAQVAPQQLQFTFSGDSISVVALAPGAYLHGKPLKPKASPALVLPYQFITVGGGTHIVLGPAAGNWPSLSASDAPPLQKEAPPATKAATEGDAAKKAADKKDKEKEPGKAEPATTAGKPPAAATDKTATPAAAATSGASAKPDTSPAPAATTAAAAKTPTDSKTATSAATAAAKAKDTKGAKDSKTSRQPPPRYIQLIYIAAGAVFLIVTILLLLYWTQPAPQTMAPLTSTELKTLLETRIKDLQMGGLIKVQVIDPVPVSPPAAGLPAAPVSTPARAEEGQVRVTGYVATDAERSALYNSLAPSLGRAQFEVFSQENILAQSADILRQLSIPVRLTVEGPGVIKAQGTVVSRASWQRALVFLKRDIRGLNQVQENLVALPEMIDEIKKILTDARIENFVRVEGTIRQLTAVGSLADNRAGAWQVAKKSILEKTAGWVQFADQVQLLSPAAMAAATGKADPENPESPANLDIQGVSAIPAFLTLKNGQVYFPGAQLPNGYTLVAIRDNKLILQKETERISLNLSDMSWQQIQTP